jgi:hypothetical protein
MASSRYSPNFRYRDLLAKDFDVYFQPSNQETEPMKKAGYLGNRYARFLKSFDRELDRIDRAKPAAEENARAPFEIKPRKLS